MAAQTTNDEMTVDKTKPTAGSGRGDSGRETSQGLEKGSLPEEGVSDCVSHRIHAIRW